MADIQKIFVLDNGKQREIVRAFIGSGGGFKEVSIAEAGKHLEAQYRERRNLFRFVAIAVSSAAIISLLARMLT